MLEMKLLLLLSAIFSVGYSDYKDDAYALKMERLRECLQEVGATMGDVDLLNTAKVPPSNEGKCLIFCFHKKYGLQTEDGSFSKDSLASVATKIKDNDPDYHDKVVGLMSKCMDEADSASSPCGKAAGLFVCYHANAESVGVIPGWPAFN